MKTASRKKQYVAIGEAAALLGVSIDTVRRWEKSGKLKAHRSIGGTRLFAVADVAKLMPEVEKSIRYLSVGQAALYLGVSTTTLRRWDSLGVLPSERTLANERMYAEAALKAFQQPSAVLESPTSTPVSFLKDKANAVSDAVVFPFFQSSPAQRLQIGVILGIILACGYVSVLRAMPSAAPLPRVAAVTTASAAPISPTSPFVTRETNSNGVAYTTIPTVYTLSAVTDTAPITLTPTAQPPLPSQPPVSFPIPSATDFLSTQGSAEQTGLTVPATALVGQAFISGTASIPAKTHQIFIANQTITAQSKIFISFENQGTGVPYVIQRQPQRGFTISLAAPQTTQITFDWLTLP